MQGRFRVGKRPKKEARVKRYEEIWIVKAWRCDTFDFVSQEEAGCSSSSSPQADTGFAFHTDRKGARRVYETAKKVRR